jgi:hypothetical protein
MSPLIRQKLWKSKGCQLRIAGAKTNEGEGADHHGIILCSAAQDEADEPVRSR